MENDWQLDCDLKVLILTSISKLSSEISSSAVTHFTGSLVIRS